MRKVHTLSNTPCTPTALSPPPTTALLLRLQPNLLLLILLEPLHLATIPIVLARPGMRQLLHIVHKPVHAPVIHPQPQQAQAAPQQQPQHQTDPEQHGAVHHVEDLEADEQRGDDDEDRGRVRLRYETGEERG